MKVKWGNSQVDGRGKQGGTVASRNRSGAYFRNKVTPSNPKTPAQTVARSGLSNYSQGWRGLTADQRTEWNNAVVNFPRTDVFHDTYTLSGHGLYVGLNNQLRAAAGTALTTPPTPGSVTGPATASVTMTKGTPSASIVFTVSPVAANMGWIVKATAGMSPGKSFVSSELRQIAVIAAAATSPYNALTAYTTKFTVVPAAGQKVFWEITPVNMTTGQKGTALRFSCIVGA